MNKIKLISFDMWGTLIKGNKEFRHNRALLVSSLTGESAKRVNEVFNEIKYDADHTVEKFGLQFSTISLYAKICDKLNFTGSASMIKTKCEQLFLENLPILMDDTIEVLSKLKADGYTLVLSSNTLLIDGNIIRKALIKLDIEKYFTFLFFSNELEISKPNPLFYKEVHENVPYLKSEIIHVGDNITTDIIGAQNYGFHAYEINTLYKTTLTTFYKSLN